MTSHSSFCVIDLVQSTRHLVKLVATIAAGILVAICSSGAQAQPTQLSALGKSAEQALYWGDFNELERLYLSAGRSTGGAVADESNPRASIRAGIAAVLQYDQLDDAYFRELDLLTGRWARDNPGSVLAQLLHARVLYARAWHIRGGGFWDSVPVRAKREFVTMIDRAEKQLMERWTMLRSDPSAHIYLGMVARSAGWDRARRRQLLQDALALSRIDEIALYEDAAISLLPKWGGEWSEVFAFIEDVDAQTRDRRGHELYALLWSAVVTDIRGNPFTQSPARWTWIREGFERLMTKHQDSFYINRAAYFACQAEDPDAARRWVLTIGDGAVMKHWVGGGAEGRTNYEACRRWLATR